MDDSRNLETFGDIPRKIKLQFHENKRNIEI